MTSPEDSLFGRIARDMGLVTEPQLRDALVEQARSSTARLLGAILVEKGFLTEDGLKKVLLAQRERLIPLKRGKAAREADSTFGSIAIQSGFITDKDLSEALLEQFRLSKKALFLKLGEVLVHRGKLTPEQVKTILRIQQDRFVKCTGCGSRFRIVEGKEGVTVPCSKCGSPITLKPGPA